MHGELIENKAIFWSSLRIEMRPFAQQTCGGSKSGAGNSVQLAQKAVLGAQIAGWVGLGLMPD